MMRTGEDKGFDKLKLVCYIFGTLFGLMALGIHFFGLPNFTNLEEQREFCLENNGMIIEPTRDNHNIMLCGFNHDGMLVEYAMDEVVNEEWAEAVGFEVGDYCFGCWDSNSCGSPHNNILREAGVHC